GQAAKIRHRCPNLGVASRTRGHFRSRHASANRVEDPLVADSSTPQRGQVRAKHPFSVNAMATCALCLVKGTAGANRLRLIGLGAVRTLLSDWTRCRDGNDENAQRRCLHAEPRGWYVSAVAL